MEKKGKNVEDMSIIELKAVLFDLDQEIKHKNAMAQGIAQILQKKMADKNAKPEPESKIS